MDILSNPVFDEYEIKKLAVGIKNARLRYPNSSSVKLREGNYPVFIRTQNPKGKSSLAMFVRKALADIKQNKEPIIQPRDIGWIWTNKQTDNSSGPNSYSKYGGMKRIWIGKWQYLPETDNIVIAFVGQYAVNTRKHSALPIEKNYNIECPELDKIFENAGV